MPEALKDQFFSANFVNQLAAEIQACYPDFNKKAFVDAVLDNAWEARELKQRMRHITQQLRHFLPDDYVRAISILKRVIGRVEGYGNMVFSDFVEVYGLAHWDVSMQAMELFTQFGSAEFAIRPFILHDQQRAMRQMLQWAQHPNEHLRRLASEGCRSRLPWAVALPAFKADPSPVLPILEVLKNDSSEYVRRSVANNLNDISKDKPDLVLALAKRWLGQHHNTNRLVKHAMRTLLKAGHTQALLLFGFAAPTGIVVHQLTLSTLKPAIGQQVQFSFRVQNETDKAAKIRIEYKVYYQKKNGKQLPKVFQLTERTFQPGETGLTKAHSFQERSTRKHYPGPHKLEVLVNGEVKAKLDFELKKT